MFNEFTVILFLFFDYNFDFDFVSYSGSIIVSIDNVTKGHWKL